MRADGVEPILFEGARVEPTDASMIEAIEFARSEGPFDAIVAIGGGSSIDTAKAVNLLVTNDGDLMDYVNAPVGRGQAPTNPLLPLVAVPTTTGTGSESTTICVLDVLAQRVKTGISHPRLRPTLAVVDPELTVTQPAGVTAAAGLDILCHALESYTARPFASYEHKNADERVPYCGSNPIADMWSEQALVLMSGAFRTAVHDGKDLDARTQVAMAATFAGLGFGNAGVHIPTPTPTRSPARSVTSAPRATTRTTRWCRTAWPSRSRRRRRSDSRSRQLPNGTCAPPSCCRKVPPIPGPSVPTIPPTTSPTC